MGVGELHDTVFLIDFGLAKHYRHQESRIHIPMQESTAFVGTPAFASLNSHLNRELSRRDDIEALAYSLMYLYRGTLPWLEQVGDHPSRTFIQKMKESMRLDSGDDADIPKVIIAVLRYARSLSFTQKPDYDYLRGLLLPAASFMLSTRGLAATPISQSARVQAADVRESPPV